jgi:CRP/FNR family transcriptional regulator
MPKPNAAGSPKEVSFEVRYLCVFGGKTVILLTVEIAGYYNGFIRNVAGILEKSFVREVAMDITDILKKVEIFRGLSLAQLESLGQISEERKYRGGETVFAERSTGDEVYIIKKGKVCIELGLKGKPDTATIQRLSVGQIFGELALVDKRSRSATVVCESDCEIITIHRNKLNELFERDTHLGYIIMKNLAQLLAERLRRTDLMLVASVLWE